MKNRRIAIVAFMLCAAMVIGLGYAAVTNVLDIQGSATVNATAAEEEFNEDIYFVGVKDNTSNYVQSIADAATYGYTANINSNNKDKAQFTVSGVDKTGEEVVITYQIKNDSAYDAAVTIQSNTNTNGEYFGFDYYFGASKDAKTATITAGGTVDVTVVVSLIKQPTSQVTSSFVLELKVSAGA